MEEMYDFNLYLLYQAMANVPLTKLEGIIEEPDLWRNKWLYIRTSIDYPITFYGLSGHSIYGAGIWDNIDPHAAGARSIRINNKISPWVAATIGLELQYLYFMSTEFNINLSFGDPMSNAFIPTIFIEQKFPIKPSKHFMLEPYLAVTFATNTSPKTREFPRIGVGGGAEFGVKGGDMGAFFVDLNFIYYLGDVVMANEDPIFRYPTQETYNRFVVGLGIGFKIGFVDRPR
jgi:hypothetical protein